MRSTNRIVHVAAALVLCSHSPTVFASEGHDHAASALPAVRLTSIDDAVNAAAYYQRQVESHIASGELEKVHASAFAARDTATSVTVFANNMAPAAQQELASTLRKIAAVTEQLDKYGDAGKHQEASAFAAKLRDEIVQLQKVTGVAIRQEWKPVLAAPASMPEHAVSKCPHKARHGGRFSMALHDNYHVEGSYPAAGEFRMHFYDKDSCPIPANAFSGRLLLQNGEEHIELGLSADASHLVGRLPSAVKPPLSVTAIVRLPHPQTGASVTEHFSYNFYSLSNPPAAAGTAPSSSLTTPSATAP